MREIYQIPRFVIPANAGVQSFTVYFNGADHRSIKQRLDRSLSEINLSWIPAFAGMTMNHFVISWA